MMLPDFLLTCTACGREAVWDTEVLPPVGIPEVGHPVLWFCPDCGQDVRHRIVDLYVITDKLHHEICIATEFDRDTVDRVMAEVYRFRQRACDASPVTRLDAAEEVEEVAAAAKVSIDVVERISVAEAAWMLRRGYIVESPGDG
jgi:hypothetical protein